MNYDQQGFVEAEDGTRLFFGVLGSGPALVLNDGIGCAGFAWRYLQPTLARSYRVIHWHYRGHGRSGLPKDRERTQIADLASDMVQLLDHLSVDKAVIAGHSMGTQVALETYRQAPERVTALWLLCGSYGQVTSHFHGSDALKRVLPSIIAQVKKRLGLARALWGRVPAGLAYRVGKMSGEFDGMDFREEDFRAYWEHIALMDPDLFLAMLQGAGDHSAEDLLPQITAPTLVVAAERDTFTPAELSEHMAKSIPGAEFLRIDGGSHAAPVEQPKTIHESFERFMRSAIGQE